MLKATLAGDVDATTAGRAFPCARAADVAFFIRGRSTLALIRLKDRI
jgi:hypothetical protein